MKKRRSTAGSTRWGSLHIRMSVCSSGCRPSDRQTVQRRAHQHCLSHALLPQASSFVIAWPALEGTLRCVKARRAAGTSACNSRSSIGALPLHATVGPPPPSPAPTSSRPGPEGHDDGREPAIRTAVNARSYHSCLPPPAHPPPHTFPFLPVPLLPGLYNGSLRTPRAPIPRGDPPPSQVPFFLLSTSPSHCPQACTRRA